MALIEPLVWLLSGSPPEFDGGFVLMHLQMAVLVCGCGEVFRTDDHHNKWHGMLCMIGLICALLALLVCALSGLQFGSLSLSNAGFVAALSLVVAALVFFLTIGLLALAGHAFELILMWIRRRHAPA